jgi:hypothetical protein
MLCCLHHRKPAAGALLQQQQQLLMQLLPPALLLAPPPPLPPPPLVLLKLDIIFTNNKCVTLSKPNLYQVSHSFIYLKQITNIPSQRKSWMRKHFSTFL